MWEMPWMSRYIHNVRMLENRIAAYRDIVYLSILLNHTKGINPQSYAGPTFHTCTLTSVNYITDSFCYACRVTSISCVSYLERTNSPMEQSNARWEWFRYEVTVRDRAERSAAGGEGRAQLESER